MSSTLVNLLKHCCYYWNIPFPSVATIYNATDPGARQLLYTLYEVLDELKAAGCWREQVNTWTVTTSNGRARYQLPADFFRMSPFTEWNSTEKQRLIGPITDSLYAEEVSGSSSSSNRYEYRIKGFDLNQYSSGGQFELFPTPTSTQTLYFEYLRSSRLIPPFWTPSTAYTSGTSYVTANGNIYKCRTSGTSSSGSTAPSGTGTNITDGTAAWDYLNAPYEFAQSDNDLMIFPDDVIRLGVRAKWRDEKGEDAAKAEQEYKARILEAQSRLRPVVIRSIGQERRNGLRYSYPSGSWSI